MIGTAEAVQGVLDFSMAYSARDSQPLPVEVLADDGRGQAWLKIGGEWSRVVRIENLWKLDAMETGGQSTIRMHFRAVTDAGQTVRLFQDLCRGDWFQQAAPAGAVV